MRRPQSPPSMDLLWADRGLELVSALRDPGYDAFVRKCQSKYRHWDKARVIARGEKLDPQLAWACVENGRGPLIRPLPLSGPNEGQLRYSTPDVVHRHLSEIDRRMTRGISAGDLPLSEAERQRFVIRGLREEAITSSMLEGAATTRREAQELLRTGRPVRSTGEQMVLNNFRAMEFIREHRRTAMSPEFLLEVQSLLTGGTLERADEVGRFRRADESIDVIDVRSGDVMHTPPPAEELTRRLNQLCQFANTIETERRGEVDDEDFLHPVLRAIALHFQVGFVHPFCDGNGRTARALFYWSMLRAGYDLFEYLPISRFIYRAPVKYQRAYLYVETDRYDLTYFFVYHLRIIREAIRELEEHVLAEKQARRERRATARPSGISDRQWRALQDLRDDPDGRSLTVQTYQTRYDVSYGTARGDLFDLEARGALRKVKVGRQFHFSPR